MSKVSPQVLFNNGSRSNTRRGSRIVFALTVLASLGNSAALADGPPLPASSRVDFGRDIRPILAEHCWSCHGPDQAARKARLRLDLRDVAVKRGAIVPGDAEAGTLLDRVDSEDPEFRMPPPKAGKDLNDRQRRLLRDWIAQGAEYREHWAFRRPSPPRVPSLRDSSGARNPVDHFIRERLERECLPPAPQADRSTLLRRVSLDLIGLSPTIEEQDAFLADTSPDAYERAVDRLLASPRYAEKMAQHWLDAARYSDTNGYNNDEDRIMWPWRDWVIRAFRGNLPFDAFIVEQLAGDLLPSPTLDQKIASGFHRNQGHNTEGGIIPEEYRVEYVADRVHTTATVFLGLSLQCARCHDHKYDPFSQRDYYRFYGFFNSLDEKQGRYNGAVAIEPYLKVPTPEQAARLSEFESLKKDVERRIASREREADRSLEAFEKSASPDVLATHKRSGLRMRIRFDQPERASSAVDATPGSSFGLLGDPKPTPGKFGSAIELSERDSIDLGDQGRADEDGAFTFGLWIRPASIEAATILSKTADQPEPRGYALFLEKGRVGFKMSRRGASDGLRVLTKETVAPNAWKHVLVIHDGTRKAKGLSIRLDGKPASLEVAQDNLSGSIATNKRLILGSRPKSPPFKGALDEFQWFGEALDEANSAAVHAGKTPVLLGDSLAIPPARRTPEQAAVLRRVYLERIDATYPKLLQEKSRVAGELEAFEKTLPLAMVMRDLPKPRETFVLTRGQYDRPGEKVEPDLPATLASLPPGSRRDRLSLARWIADPANPLTARVAVNRWWEIFFGVGLVKTVEDFGVMGEAPSHPELLDFLATEFVRSGWDVKALQRLIVTSATYRGDSRATRSVIERDPENRLLSRGPRFRLPAETLRDNALAIAGLLRGTLGGPSVKPYQPEGLWEDVSVERRAKYVPDRGDGLYRRSMYTFWKRTCPPPTMTSFDATNREVCVVRRGRTNTPLQALILLNDPTYVEAARKTAERVMLASSDLEGRVRLAFRLAASRLPDTEELAILAEVHRSARARYSQDKAAAEKLLSAGESPRLAGADPVELAAWTVTCATLLNLDEVISKR